MTDQHNDDIPAVGNQIVSDIEDIKENIEFHKDVFESFLNAWSDTDATNKYPVLLSDADLDTLVQVEESADEDIIRFDCGGAEQVIVQDTGIIPTVDNDIDLGDGTHELKDIYFVGVGYIDTVKATNYQFDGGSYNAVMPSNGITGNAIFMTGDSNTIMWFYNNTAEPGWKVLTTGQDTVLAVSGGSQDYNADGGTQGGSWTISGITRGNHTHSLNDTGNTGDLDNWYGSTTATGSQNTSTVSSYGTWRMSGSIGKLFQLDTA